jgi:hypothetical protein
MQRGEYKSASKERKARWDARKQRWPLWPAKHRYQRNGETDVSDRKRQVLPTGGADLRKQMLNRVHRFPSVERRAAEALNPLLGQIASAVGFLREQGMTVTSMESQGRQSRVVARNTCTILREDRSPKRWRRVRRGFRGTLYAPPIQLIFAVGQNEHSAALCRAPYVERVRCSARDGPDAGIDPRFFWLVEP